jgi:radical SAM protein with 4Fe4S-binding SPASM domain
MVPKKETDTISMSAETFEKMLFITEKMFEKGDYDNASFRLSGGEPFLVWKNYAGLVSKYIKKCKGKMSFGLLSNLTILTDDMIEWMLKNKLGVQVSLDDLENSKPLNTGESSSLIVLKNIERLKEAKVPFSINTVFDYEKTKSLKRLIDYICRQPISQYGFSASFTINDDTYIDEIIDQIKLAVLRLKENRFDLRNKFRFYNEIIGSPGRTCSAGVGIFALGTNLEVWPCQSMINNKPLGYFNENLKDLLATSEDNKYFYKRTLLPQCTDCSVLNWCRGGCRAVHLTDLKAVELTCRIKQEIINFILRETETQGYNNKSYNNCQCNHSTENNDLEKYIVDYMKNLKKEEIKLVETPDLPDD